MKRTHIPNQRGFDAISRVSGARKRYDLWRFMIKFAD